MVTAYSSWWPDTMIWRSTNAGATWSRIWDWTRYPNRSFRYVHDISAAPWLYWGGPPGGGRPGAEVFPKLGWMTESLEIDPHDSNKMMYGTGATIYGSDDLTVWDQGTTSQITIKVKAVGLEETAIQELVSPPAGPPLLSGMYDVYGFAHTDLDTVPQAFYDNPRIATVSIDYAEANPSFVFRVGDGDAANMLKSAGYSTNGGSSWTPVGNEPAGTTNGGTVAVSTSGTRVVWSPEGAGVHYTSNNGSAWTASTGIPAGAIVESDRVNANTFYGFKSGVFYLSTNGGASFAPTAAAGLPAEGPVTFKAIPGHEGQVWLAGGAEGSAYGLWRSTDAGGSFTRLANVEQADTIGFGKAAPGQTYPALYTSARVASLRGIFRSDDAGASWLRINDDDHQWGWTGKAISGDPRVYGRVYVATNGRGILYGEPEGGGGGCTAQTASVSAIVVTTVGAGQGKKRGQAQVTIHDDCGAPVANATVSGTFSGSINQSVVAATAASGVATFTTTATAGGSVSITFCVTGLAHAQLAYAPGANVETCDGN
jgi:xyloglucan-specific exo-beta-1,4-glucanase